MTNPNTMIPAALANNAEAELSAFRALLNDKACADVLGSVGFDFENVVQYADPDDLGDIKGENAVDIVAHLDEAIDSIEGLLAGYRTILDAYLNYLGIPSALVVMAENLKADKTEEGVKALRYGLELMWNSKQKLPPALRRDLHALGMPKTIGGRAVNSYQRACGDWMRNILPVSPATDGTVDFLEEGATPAPLSQPIFVDMTPEDEAAIRRGA